MQLHKAKSAKDLFSFVSSHRDKINVYANITRQAPFLPTFLPLSDGKNDRKKIEREARKKIDQISIITGF
jgi:hypothetical protein